MQVVIIIIIITIIIITIILKMFKLRLHVMLSTKKFSYSEMALRDRQLATPVRYNNMHTVRRYALGKQLKRLSEDELFTNMSSSTGFARDRLKRRTREYANVA